MSMVGASTSLPGCGPSCEEGPLDTLGREAPNVSGSTGMVADFGPGRSYRDGTDGVGAPGISCALKPVSSVSKVSQVWQSSISLSW